MEGIVTPVQMCMWCEGALCMCGVRVHVRVHVCGVRVHVCGVRVHVCGVRVHVCGVRVHVCGVR